MNLEEIKKDLAARGEDPGVGLKVVDDSLKVRGGNARDTGSVTLTKKHIVTKSVITGEPKNERANGNHWIVENQSEGVTVIDEARMGDSVTISTCEDCTIQVEGRVKNILLERCHRVKLSFNKLLSTLDIVNCKNVTATILGSSPSLSIDESQSISVIIQNPDAVESTSIYSSKSSDMNLYWYKYVEDGELEMVEAPIPEQFVTTINAKGKAVTTVSDLYG